jgi:hypothetical protein
MSNKRVKRVHISGWLEVFLTDTIMARVAHYLDTPTLFRLLLGVNKELRNKATRSKRWNLIMDYQTRMITDLRVIYPYKDNQNLLAKFVKRLYAKTACSFCFQMIANKKQLKTRPDSECLKSCRNCGHARNVFVDKKDLAVKFVPHPDMYAEIPSEGLWKQELDSFRPTLYTRNELWTDYTIFDRRYNNGRRFIDVIDFDGKLHIARVRKDVKNIL